MKTTKSKTQTSVIRATDGSRLRLTPTRLIQIDHDSARPWYAKKQDLLAAFNSPANSWKVIRIYEVGSSLSIMVSFWNEGQTIGCSEFDAKTLRQIRRYYGARKTRALAAKAGV